MLKATLHNVWGALNDFSSGLGVVIAVFATAFSIPAIQSPWSLWLWIAVAILFFVRSVKLYQELESQKEVIRKPSPTMKLGDLLVRIVGKPDIFGPDNSESMQVLASLTLIREKAQNDELKVFGRGEWRSTRPADMETLAPRSEPPRDCRRLLILRRRSHYEHYHNSKEPPQLCA